MLPWRTASIQHVYYHVTEFPPVYVWIPGCKTCLLEGWLRKMLWEEGVHVWECTVRIKDFKFPKNKNCNKKIKKIKKIKLQTHTHTHKKEIPFKNCNRIAYDSAIYCCIHKWGNQNWKRHLHPSVHRAPFIYQTWKQPRCPSKMNRCCFSHTYTQ